MIIPPPAQRIYGPPDTLDEVGASTSLLVSDDDMDPSKKCKTKKESSKPKEEVALAAGGVRATLITFLRTLIRLVPRMPAVKFFRPKARAKIVGKEGESAGACWRRPLCRRVRGGKRLWSSVQ